MKTGQPEHHHDTRREKDRLANAVADAVACLPMPNMADLCSQSARHPVFRAQATSRRDTEPPGDVVPVI